MTDRASVLADRVVAELARPKFLGMSSRSASEHRRISNSRADRDRVSKDELEQALRIAGLANLGEQSAAARVIGCTEGAIRHWRDRSMPRFLPPRSAVVRLMTHAKNRPEFRRLVGVK